MRSTTSADASVEVAELADGGRAVRDTKDRTGPVLTFTPAEWAAFPAGVCDGGSADRTSPLRLRRQRSTTGSSRRYVCRGEQHMLLCRRHHMLVHRPGWDIHLDPDGHPIFTPPALIDPSRKPRPSRHWSYTEA